MEKFERIDPPVAGSEKEVLSGFLDFLRGTIVCKLNGLSEEQARRPHYPSGLTLLGIIKHLSDVERSWFREVFLGEDLGHLWDADDAGKYWRIEAIDTTADIVASYDAEVARAREIVAETDLDTLAAAPGPGMEGLQLHWIVIHMVEETARHCGHADLIRESIDGQTGE